MAKFFEKLNASGGQQLQILSDHPNPGNREVAIQAEMRTLPARKTGLETGQFLRVKKEVASLPPPVKKAAPTIAPGAGVPATPDAGEWQGDQGSNYTMKYPKGWQASADDSGGVTLAPRDGVAMQGGAPQVGFGTVVGLF